MAAPQHPRDPNHLKAAMVDAGLDTVRLAKLAGITRQHVSLVLNGERGCSPAVAARIARALNVPVGDLFADRRVFGEITTNPHPSRMERTVMSPSKTTAETTADDPYLTLDEFSERYGVPVGTVRDWRLRQIGPPFFRVGRRLRIRTSVADQWWREHEQQAS